MILVQGTSSKLKYDLMKDRLKDLDIELIRPVDLNINIDIEL